MYDDTRLLLRGLGVLGASFLVLATFLPWFSYQVLLPAGRVVTVLDIGVSLWAVTTVAATLFVVGGVVAAVMLTVVASRLAGVVTALVGLGAVAYTVVRCFSIPDLGINRVASILPTAHATTTLEGGLFLGMAGGLMLLFASLADLLPAKGDEARAPATEEASAPGRSRMRRRRGVPVSGRGVRR
ncbi:MAG: hypothetical protein JWP17_4220 [Solirubrobacterales bacterium]|jgi:hypothetical protein|nr:hypothetical protein [Solirubrobacterales bacterium]